MVGPEDKQSQETDKFLEISEPDGSSKWQQFAPPVQDPADGFRVLSEEEERQTSVLGLAGSQERAGGSPYHSGVTASDFKNFKDPLIGATLEGRYHILSVLGWGGMSVVYKARQDPLDRLVAIKTVKFRVDERPEVWRRFEREIRTLSKLSHPNIVSVYDCIVGDDGQPYVVMDFLKGHSLDQILQEKGRFDLRTLARVGSQVAAAVGHAHRNEVIHRDLKPANIMLVDDINHDSTGGGAVKSIVKVVDFGLAKLGEDSRRLTNSGELWGSPPYMSPEQIKGAAVDGRADIYALGAVIFEMATGKDPFWGAGVYELLHKHVYEEPPTLKEACPEEDFPEALQWVIDKALAKNPDERFQTMTDLREALEKACGGFSEVAVSRGAKSPRQSMTRQPAVTKAELESARFQTPLGMALISLGFVFCALVFVRSLGGSGVLPRTKVERNIGASVQLSPSESSAGVGTGSGTKSGEENAPKSGAGNADEDAKKVAPSHSNSSNFSLSSVSYSRARARHRDVSQRSKNSSQLTQKSTSNVPNNSGQPVKRTKFDILRSMKNPALRKECGDNQ